MNRICNGNASSRHALMKRAPLALRLCLLVVLLVDLLAAGVARADPVSDGNVTNASPPASVSAQATNAPSPSPVEPIDAPHANPRLKLAYRSFSVGNVSATPVPLAGLELNLYALSTRWVRAGFTIAGGRGQGAMEGRDVNLHYGLLGVAGGFQYPARITPFVEAQLSGGILTGTVDGALAVPGTSVSITGASAATWIYGRGVDVGAEIYTVGRLYLSGSVGWLRTTWRGVDSAAITEAPAAGLRFKDVTADSLTFKLGVGF